jgi:signal peptide peptidase SppA
VSNLIAIAHAVYCEPWLIEPAMHRVLADIVEAHIKGGETEHAYRLRGDMLAATRAKEPATDAAPYEVRDGVAVVPLYGVIGRRVGAMEKSSGVTDVDVFQRAVARAAADDSVKAILIDVDSPGGSVAGVQSAADGVRAATYRKRVMAYSGGTMASAAYWIATGADAIYADQTAMIGSIGVYAQILDASRAMENAGLRQQVFASGKFKAAGAGGSSLTDEQRVQIQGRVDDLAAVFKADVRRYNPAVSDDSMQGQVFIGARAVAAGLVNSVASFEKAFSDLQNWK